MSQQEYSLGWLPDNDDVCSFSLVRFERLNIEAVEQWNIENASVHRYSSH